MMNQLVNAAKSLFLMDGYKVKKSEIAIALTDQGIDQQTVRKVWTLLTKSGYVIKGQVKCQELDRDRVEDVDKVIYLTELLLAQAEDDWLLFRDLSIVANECMGLSDSLLKMGLSYLENHNRIIFNQAVPPAHVIKR